MENEENEVPEDQKVPVGTNEKVDVVDNEPVIKVKTEIKMNVNASVGNNEEVCVVYDIVPVITKVKKGIKMDVSAGGFLNFIKANTIYLDKSILIKDIIDNAAGNHVFLKILFFNSSKYSLDSFNLEAKTMGKNIEFIDVGLFFEQREKIQRKKRNFRKITNWKSRKRKVHGLLWQIYCNSDGFQMSRWS